LAEVSGSQNGAARGQQRVMATLIGCAAVTLDLLLGRGSAEAGVFVGGIAHAGGGQLGHDGLEGGPQFRGDQPGQAAHPVGALAAQPQAAACPTLPVGEVPVGIEDRHEMVGQLLESLWVVLPGQQGQVTIGGVPGFGGDRRRNLGVGLAGDCHVLGTDLPGGLRGGQPRQLGLERLSGHRGARPQLGGFLHPAACLGGADTQPLGQRGAQRGRSQLAGTTAGQPGQDPMIDHRRPP